MTTRKIICVGDTCVVSRGIFVGDQLAFYKGEKVVVERVSPNPQRPEYKYVVLSKHINQRFHLSEKDIVVMRETLDTISKLMLGIAAVEFLVAILYLFSAVSALTRIPEISKMKKAFGPWIHLDAFVVACILSIVLSILFLIGAILAFKRPGELLAFHIVLGAVLLAFCAFGLVLGSSGGSYSVSSGLFLSFLLGVLLLVLSIKAKNIRSVEKEAK